MYVQSQHANKTELKPQTLATNTLKPTLPSQLHMDINPSLTQDTIFCITFYQLLGHPTGRWPDEWWPGFFLAVCNLFWRPPLCQKQVHSSLLLVTWYVDRAFLHYASPCSPTKKLTILALFWYFIKNRTQNHTRKKILNWTLVRPRNIFFDQSSNDSTRKNEKYISQHTNKTELKPHTPTTNLKQKNICC